MWPNIVYNLSENTTNPEIELKKAAILTLGAICEVLVPFFIQKDVAKQQSNILPSELCQNIQSGIMLGMNEQNNSAELQIIALKSFQDSLSFLIEYFDNSKVVEFTLNVLLSLCMKENEELAVKALICLNDFVGLHSNKLENYIPVIYNALEVLLVSNNQDIGKQAVDIWATISRNELKKKRKFVFLLIQVSNNASFVSILEPIAPNLLQNIMRNLTRETDEEEDEETITSTSFSCLCDLMELFEMKHIDLFTAFISTGILAFGAMIEAKDQIKGMIGNVLMNIVPMIGDSNLNISLSACKVLQIAGDYIPDTIIEHPNGQDFLNMFREGMNKATPRVSASIFWIIANIAEFYQNSTNNLWEKELENTLSAVLISTKRKDIPQSVSYYLDHAFVCILSIVQRCGNDETLRKFLNHFITTLKNELDILDEISIKGYLSAIQAIFLRIGDKLEIEYHKETYKIVDNYFQKIKTVNSDGITLLGCLAMGNPSFFGTVFETSWKYTEYCLTQTEDAEIKAALTAIGDYCKSVPHLVAPYLPVLVNFIDNSINNVNFSRDVKLFSYTLIGDISLGMGKMASPYIDIFIKLLNLGGAASLELMISGVSDNVEYSESLKERIIEGYCCVLLIIQDFKQEVTFRKCIPGIIAFIEQSTAIAYSPTIDYVRQCLNLIGDIVSNYSENANNILNSQVKRYLVNHLSRFDGKENRNTLQFLQNVENKFLL